MPTKGALTGLHGGYSEPGAGAARSADALIRRKSVHICIAGPPLDFILENHTCIPFPLYIAAYAYGIPTARQRAESASALYARP